MINSLKTHDPATFLAKYTWGVITFLAACFVNGEKTVIGTAEALMDEMKFEYTEEYFFKALDLARLAGVLNYKKVRGALVINVTAGHDSIESLENAFLAKVKK